MDITIERYSGSHRDLDWSFREAEESEELLDAYIDLGRLWVARATGGEVIGHLQAVPRDEESWEVTSTAVVESQRGQGARRALLERAVDEARAAGAHRLILATGTARRQPALLSALRLPDDSRRPEHVHPGERLPGRA